MKSWILHDSVLKRRLQFVGVLKISGASVLPCSGEKVAREHIVQGAGDHSTTITVQ